MNMIFNTNYFIENNKPLSKYVLDLNSKEYKKFIKILESRLEQALELLKNNTIKYVKTKKILKEL